MNSKQIFICGTGIISPLGPDIVSTVQALHDNRSAIRPLDVFTTLQEVPLPVGQVTVPVFSPSTMPRTHCLASLAARQAMDGYTGSVDAIVIGTTTGGMLSTEQLLRDNVADGQSYQYHGLGTVAEHLAQEFDCSGPALTVSTACSSGAVAITLARHLLNSGQAETVLVGGVDSLCRLTYYGFHSLQLVDQSGAKPLDQERNGMAVAEGAGMLLLSIHDQGSAQAELLGTALSCDAYHPAAPHPEGQGAYMAMKTALEDAGLCPDQIDYINLHGTGTRDNDLAESKALRRLFPDHLPFLSSIKGATGHSLAAAGAIEAVLAVIAITENLVPANTNLKQVDPELGLQPVMEPQQHSLRTVLSNSFGFGGNNGSLVIGKAKPFVKSAKPTKPACPECTSPIQVAVHGYSCISEAGMSENSIAQMQSGKTVAGMADLALIAQTLPPRVIRRLKRLSQMTLALAQEALKKASPDQPDSVDSLFMGTGWGALSETYDFLDRLVQTKEQFPSPTDFIGSVHNGPAGQAAIMFGAKGANITSSGGDYSFEHSLLAASQTLADQETGLLIGADEGHHELSPLFDLSISQHSVLTDGGAAFRISKQTKGAICTLSLPYCTSQPGENWCKELTKTLFQEDADKRQEYALILAGIPAAMKDKGEEQLSQFLAQSGLWAPVLRYRDLVGEFASASALATALAVSLLEQGYIPAVLSKEKTTHKETRLDSREHKILILGLGKQITAMELGRP